MEKSYIHQRFQPKLNNPTFIEGLPGFGNVGKVAAQLLTKFSEAKLFAEYYSPYFPDYVVVNKEGICTPPRYKLYAPPTGKKLNAIILTGNSQPSLDNVTAHYEICEELLDYAQKLGSNTIITIGGVPISSEKKDVYVAATSTELTTKIMEKGCIIYGKGRIMGATGLLLGLAKERGLDGICLLGATEGLRTDKDAGFAVFNMLTKILEAKNQTTLEEEKG